MTTITKWTRTSLLAKREFKARPATKAQCEQVKKFYYFYPEKDILTDDDSLMYEPGHEQWVEIEVIPDLTDYGLYFGLNDATWRPTGFSTGRRGLEAYIDAIQAKFEETDWAEVFTNDPVYDIR